MEPKGETAETKQPTLIFKVMIIGPARVGKTSLVTRFVDGRFDVDTRGTIGVDFSLKNISIDVEPVSDQLIQLQLWDFAGEEQFKRLLPIYLGGTNGFIIVYDLTRLETFYELPEWLKVIGNYAFTRPLVLLGMKKDLIGDNSIPDDFKADVDAFMKKYNIAAHFYASAKTGENVETTFTTITYAILKHLHIVSDN